MPLQMLIKAVDSIAMLAADQRAIGRQVGKHDQLELLREGYQYYIFFIEAIAA